MKECRKRSGNLINRKLSEFYIEAVPRFFFQLRKKIFLVNFFRSTKKFAIEKISVEKTFEKKMLNQNFYFFLTEHFSIFFDRKKIYFFRS